MATLNLSTLGDLDLSGWAPHVLMDVHYALAAHAATLDAQGESDRASDLQRIADAIAAALSA
jgi:hypothetical protein